MSSNYRNTWETYTSSWKVSSREEKEELFQRALAKSCRYTDPVAQHDDWDALLAYMQEFHQQVPGAYFVTREFWAHHGCSGAHWDMNDGAGKKLSEGFSYGTYDESGRLTSMTGFFDVPG